MVNVYFKIDDVKEFDHPVYLTRLVQDPDNPRLLIYHNLADLYFESNEDAEKFVHHLGGRGWRWHDIFTHRMYHHRMCECGDCPTQDNPPNSESNRYKIGWTFKK